MHHMALQGLNKITVWNDGFLLCKYVIWLHFEIFQLLEHNKEIHFRVWATLIDTVKFHLYSLYFWDHEVKN